VIRRVHTDGACRGNPGPGGWAWAADESHYGAGPDANTTNQRMELTAVIEALRSNPDGEIEVFSDSTYVVHCFRDQWYVGWKKRGWRNSQRQPVANRDLWESLFALTIDVGRPVSFSWVKGHAGDKMNEFVDSLATLAADTQTARHAP
jgi:ribonuclease HI